MNLAIALLEVQIAWDEFETALSAGSPNASAKASAWWLAREAYRECLLQKADA